MTDLSLDARYQTLRESRLPDFPRYSAFGRDDDNYDLGGPAGDGENNGDDDFGDGAPGVNLVTEALAVWAAGWQRFDVDVAASVFNLDEKLIEEARPAPIDYARKTPQIAGRFDVCVQLIASGRDQYGDEMKSATVAEVAALMNVDELAVADAVEAHCWMMLGDERDGSPTIEHEGE